MKFCLVVMRMEQRKIYETCQIFFFKDLVIHQRSRVSKCFYLSDWTYSDSKVEAICRQISSEWGESVVLEFGAWDTLKVQG